MPFKPSKVFFPHFPSPGQPAPAKTLSDNEVNKYGKILAQKLFDAAMDDTGANTLLTDFGNISSAYDATGIYDKSFELKFYNTLSGDGYPSTATLYDAWLVWAKALARFLSISAAFAVGWKEYDNNSNPGDDAKVLHELFVPDPSTAT